MKLRLILGDQLSHSISSLSDLIKMHNPQEIIVTEGSEYRVLEDMKSWGDAFGLPVDIRADDRFLCSPDEFAAWADGRKELRMEYFYREMRRKYNILMEGDKPVGGAWNFDQENRKPPKDGLDIPQTYTAQTDDITQDCIALVADKFADHFGDLYPFYFAVTRDQALYALNKFIDERLVNFGDYQDAMIQGEPWMYHSHLSFYINCGLLSPMECVERAEQAYRTDGAPLNAVEGFIRQIIQCVSETKENAYAHHIQRLMVLGNFSLIAGLSPEEVNDWYMIVYADAYQWVELPNVTGMILFADGGVLGSKPYAASGSYINKMSDYCKGCSYSPTVKNGPKACPFNYLYWDFLIRNEDKLRGNHRCRGDAKLNT